MSALRSPNDWPHRVFAEVRGVALANLALTALAYAVLVGLIAPHLLRRVERHRERVIGGDGAGEVLLHPLALLVLHQHPHVLGGVPEHLLGALEALVVDLVERAGAGAGRRLPHHARLALGERVLGRVLGVVEALHHVGRRRDEDLGELPQRHQRRSLRDLGAHVIVPIQRGELVQFRFDAACAEVLGFDDFVIEPCQRTISDR